ncbi:TPA: 50S ribosomal protein L28 [Candidatus Komeilibacteria bacterium]|nr:MAG: hypothetical protein A2260_03955 [Candidatus Komeilibacteria bacterium RIFOXYA2_FULL_45_9]OGY93319.1 MAG: hypothetical protein A3J95_02990 [Candidatus Komeilibacteria bacterium RIFOXYC2_FULL_45_12]HAH04576.1 50S ribosomal protein L28 [Candidatus Komeilibacteria bacterium]HBV02202.1 50S ribosomal protein L28 [Candidatus Komeilibacteria bacterium]HCC73180.1 50S ribosomal protein L28 [Candidatus Komeilibacteria bacterium]
MSKVCQICGNGPTSGIRKSHSNIKSKRQVNINLQVKKIDGQKKRVCTSCLKSLSKPKAK